jgi:hypothetical protein
MQKPPFALSLSKGTNYSSRKRGFDKLSPTGFGFARLFNDPACGKGNGKSHPYSSCSTHVDANPDGVRGSGHLPVQGTWAETLPMGAWGNPGF